MTVAELNALESAAAADVFIACCAAPAWVAWMVAGRPYASRDAVIAAAGAAGRDLTPADWDAAIAHHPRIGESGAAAMSGTRAVAWSAGEQAGARDADDATGSALARGNAEYERRFGHTCIINATGKSAGDMLAVLTVRLELDAAAERRATADELRQITLLRVAKLVADG